MGIGLQKDRLHHAYLIEGDRSDVLLELTAFIEKELEMKLLGHPDIQLIETDTLLIDDVHLLRARERQSAFAGGKKIFIIAADTVMHEAQQALLKTFEEPSPGTHFFLITRETQRLLPTLRSRLLHVRLDSKKKPEHKDVAEFVAGDIVSRMKIASKLVAKKDKDVARKFLDDLLIALTHDAYDAKYIEEVLRARSYVNDKGASLKIIFEALALLPMTQMESM